MLYLVSKVLYLTVILDYEFKLLSYDYLAIYFWG